MKSKALILVILTTLAIGFYTCKKAENLGEDVFIVTYLHPSDGCPGGPLIKFNKKDVERMKQFLPEGYQDRYNGDGSQIAATNLDISYNLQQRLTIKVRQPVGEEVPFCNTFVLYYPSIYVLEVRTD